MAIYNKESHIFIKGGHLFYKNEPGICFEPGKDVFPEGCALKNS